jgi:hypothetical protein
MLFSEGLAMSTIQQGMLYSLLSVLSLFVHATEYEKGILVVNSKNQLNNLSTSQVENIFLARTQKWPSGESIWLCMQMGEDSATESFLSTVIKKSPNAFRAYWNRMMFSGQARPMSQVDSDIAIIQFIQENTGGLCFVNGELETVPQDVKIISYGGV